MSNTWVFNRIENKHSLYRERKLYENIFLNLL